MKVALGTIEVTDVQRRAIRHRYGKTGLATREEVRREYIHLVEADMEEIVGDLLEARPYWWDRS